MSSAAVRTKSANVTAAPSPSLEGSSPARHRELGLVFFTSKCLLPARFSYAGALTARIESKPKLTTPTPPADDPPQEECQEGYSVLPDGLRCFRNWYVPINTPSFPLNWITTACDGLLPFSKANTHTQAAPPLSTPFAVRTSSSTRTPMMPPMRTLRTALRSSPSPSVRNDSKTPH